MPDPSFINGKASPAGTGMGITALALAAFDVTAGNAVIVLTGTEAQNIAVSKVEDTAGNVYVKCGTSDVDIYNYVAECWVAWNIATQADNIVTVTWTDSVNNPGAIAAQYAGLSRFVSQSTGLIDNDVLTHVSNSVNVSKIPAVCLGHFQGRTGITHVPTGVDGCTVRVSFGDINNDNRHLVERIAASPGAKTLSVTTALQDDWYNVVFVFDQGATPATVDKAQMAGKVATQTLSWLHECFGANRVLLIGVGVSGSQTVQSATFKGAAMSYLGVANDGVDGSFRVEIWGLPNPAAGAAYEILVTLTGTPSVQQTGASLSLYDCDQSSPFGTVFAATGRTGTAPSIEVTDPETADAVVDFAISAAGFVSSNKTPRVLENTGSSDYADNIACSTALAASAVTMGYTINNGAYALAAVRVKKRQNQGDSPALVSGWNAVKLFRGLRTG